MSEGRAADLAEQLRQAREEIERLQIELVEATALSDHWDYDRERADKAEAREAVLRGLLERVLADPTQALGYGTREVDYDEGTSTTSITVTPEGKWRREVRAALASQGAPALTDDGARTDADQTDLIAIVTLLRESRLTAAIRRAGLVFERLMVEGYREMAEAGEGAAFDVREPAEPPARGEGS